MVSELKGSAGKTGVNLDCLTNPSDGEVIISCCRIGCSEPESFEWENTLPKVC